MKIWLITTGSSDVQLLTSDYWNHWYRPVKQNCYRLPFEPIQLAKEVEQYRIAPRILAEVYMHQPEDIWEHLKFPLLQEFVAQLQDESIDKIILLLTDQSQVFDEEQRNDTRCPYWQDTVALQPLIEQYLGDHLPDTEVIPLILTPKPDQGLDDWDQVLTLVRSELGTLQLEPDTVYVSHQAGTPAISSAVQFVSLARFRSDVQFLVSNEYRPEQTRRIPKSSYLKGIQLQEARALLDRYDYNGTRSLLSSINAASVDFHRIEQLLEIAILWNFVKFELFAQQIRQSNCLSLVKDVAPFENWWWLGYEAAYLALIRLKQGDATDAFFHSFRAIEGAFALWGKQEFHSHILLKNERAYLELSILDDKKDYFKLAKYKQDGRPRNDVARLKSRLEELKNQAEDENARSSIILYGEHLYTLFRVCREDYKEKCKDLANFWDPNRGIAERRNKIFHQLEGLSEEDLLEAWEVNHQEELEAKLLRYLNFITQQNFSSIAQASLMAQIHQELVELIDRL